MSDLGVIVKRVSGHVQQKNTSRDTQDEDARALAIREGIQVVNVFDEGVVGGSFYLARDGLQEAIRGVELGKWTHIIFGQFDRSARDVVVLETIYKRVYAAGGKIHHADITFEESNEGTMLRQIVGSLKEYEKKSIKTRTEKGRWKRARGGVQPLRSNPLYGYYIPLYVDADRGTYDRDMVGKYIVEDAQAEIVRLIYRLFTVDVMPYNAIASYLNEQGVPSPQGVRWRAETIKKLLAKSAYRGMSIFGKTRRVTDETRRSERGLKTIHINVKNEDTVGDFKPVDIPCPRIVDDATWNLAQERMALVTADHSEVKGHCGLRGSILGGIIRCPECGEAMNALHKTNNKTGKKTGYYRCPYGSGNRKQTNRAAIVNCHNGNIYSMDKLDAQALDIVLETARKPEIISSAIEAYENDFLVRDERAARLIALENEFSELAKKEIVTLRLRIAAEVKEQVTDAYDEILSEITEERKRISKGIDACPPVPPSMALTNDRKEQLKVELKNVAEILRSHEVAPADKNGVLAKVVDYAEVIGPERQIKVWFKGSSVYGSVGVPVAVNALEEYQLSATTR